MMSRIKLLCIAAFTICLLIATACGQEWLEGGYVTSFDRSGIDPGISGMVRWLDTPIQYFPWYTSVGVKYPGPYGVYPYIPQPYYSDFRLNSLAGMNWDPFQKNWSETMDYAQTKSSFRVYPISSTPSFAIQSPAPTYATTQPQVVATGDTPVTIVSQGMRGYQIFLDGNYIGTEGTGGDPLDGRFSLRVVGNRNHDIRVYDGQFNYPKTMFFQKGVQKIIYVEPGTAVYI
jgi:hypothetical protein